MSKRTCVHIIIRDKFTDGYIRFLKENDMGWNHVFCTFKGNYPLSFSDVLVFDNYSKILSSQQDLLQRCERIVIAAFFDEALALLKMPKALWQKTYIQFWGGDIYRFRNPRQGLLARTKQLIVYNLVRMCIKRCCGVLTLVEKDYDSLESIFKLKNLDHRLVQVPDDFYEINHLDYQRIVNEHPYCGKKRILIGNSATIENQHLAIFELLSRKKIDEIEVVVPLSYGDEEYREQVLSAGKRLLGTSFVPILDFMAREDYIGLLASCDTAIFNNDRQQATGNIIIMANLGKKLYLRDDTTMWSFFAELGFVLHKVKDLAEEDISTVMTYAAADVAANHEALLRMEGEAIEQWRAFLL